MGCLECCFCCHVAAKSQSAPPVAPTSVRRRRRRRRRRNCHQQLQQSEHQQESSMEISCGDQHNTIASCGSCNDNNINGAEQAIAKSSGCATPKCTRFRIPEKLSCPPAPMKKRVDSKLSSNRSPITFFASPDIELFFLSSFQNISATN